MSPSQYLTFPLLYTPNLSNGVSSQKCPGILNSKALGLLRRARSSRSRKEADSESLPQQLLSSWHIAPIHLPLLGQNCWPHLSEGFSVSLWFNIECIQEAESIMEKGKKIKKRNKSLVLRDSSLDRTGMMFLLSVTSYAFFRQHFGLSCKNTVTFSCALSMFFSLSALVMAGPDLPKPGLSDSFENFIFFCIFCFGVRVEGSMVAGPPHIQLPGGHQPHFLTFSCSCYWIRVIPDVREGEDATLRPLFHLSVPYTPAPVSPTSSPFFLVAHLSSSCLILPQCPLLVPVTACLDVSAFLQS